MHKSILVLFVTVVFVLSVGYIVVKDRKVIVEQRTASYENKVESEDKNKEIEELSYISDYNEFEENIEKNTQNTIAKTEDKIDLQEIRKEESGELLGKIIIEKINLVAPVKEGSTEEILNNYVGHIENTATYNGNIGLAAHNRGAEVSYFARLKELKIGDKITYQTNLGTRDYKISLVKEILDTDWSMLEDTSENKITLITCINNKINLRLCVQAVEI